MKVCTKCKNVLPESEFYERPEGLSNQCKPCTRAYHREWRARRAKAAALATNDTTGHSNTKSRIFRLFGAIAGLFTGIFRAWDEGDRLG
jgi:hypothetical protein